MALGYLQNGKVRTTLRAARMDPPGPPREDGLNEAPIITARVMIEAVDYLSLGKVVQWRLTVRGKSRGHASTFSGAAVIVNAGVSDRAPAPRYGWVRLKPTGPVRMS